jgi:hypothetical protein
MNARDKIFGRGSLFQPFSLTPALSRWERAGVRESAWFNPNGYIFSTNACAWLLLAILFFTATLTRATTLEADVALSYSPDAATRQGSQENIEVNLANAIVGANVIHDNSQTGVRWRIAGFIQSSANPVSQDNNYVLGLVNSDASFQDVRDFGASVGADLVSYYAHTTGAAGNAYQPGNYSTMGEQWIWYIVVAHELGHNYGCDHGNGLGFTGTNGAPYRTVMLHNYCGGSDIPYYSNPNLYFQGVQLLGTATGNCSTGTFSTGDNAAQIRSRAQTVSDFRKRVVSPPQLNGLRYRWSFNSANTNTAAGTIFLDSKSGAAAVVRGAGALVTNGALRLPGGTTGNVAANSMGAYLDLPNGIISAMTNFTIEIWATPLSVQNWQRLFDFGRTAQTGNGVAGEWTGVAGSAAPGVTTSYDDMFLSLCVAADLNQQRIEARNNGGTQLGENAALGTAIGTKYHYAFTFEDGVGTNGAAGGRIKWFRDGNQIAYKDVAFHLRDLEDVNNWLGRSMFTADNNANADYDEVRIHNVALTANQILAHYLVGPNVVVPTTPNVAGTLYVDLRPTNVFNGTWTNAGSLGNFSKIGTPTFTANVGGTTVPGVLFNGTSDAYAGPNSVADLEGDSDRSIEVWAYNPATATEETMVSWAHRNTTRGDVAFNYGNSGGWGAFTHFNDDVSWITPPTVGTWHHLVYTYSNSEPRLYLDGTFQNNKLLAGALVTFAGEPINLGCQRDSANGTRSAFYSGYLNSIRIHGGVLTPEQIAGNYLLGPAGLVSNSPPVLTAISNRTIIAGATLIVTNTATDTDVPAQTLTFAMANNISGASVNASSGVFTWRPVVALAGASPTIKIKVSDSGLPNLSATQSFFVSITAPAPPQLTPPALTNGALQFSITSGDLGPDYLVQASTNLADWTTVLTTNPLALPFQFSEPADTNSPQRYYRTRLGP